MPRSRRSPRVSSRRWKRPRAERCAGDFGAALRDNRWMQLRIRSITYLAEDVLGFELTDPNEHDLPRFTAGAHVAIRVAPGLLRDYSLCNDPAERRRYCVAVLKDKEGHGSDALHERGRGGDPLAVAGPRDLFPLAEEAVRDWM